MEAMRILQCQSRATAGGTLVQDRHPYRPNCFTRRSSRENWTNNDSDLSIFSLRSSMSFEPLWKNCHSHRTTTTTTTTMSSLRGRILGRNSSTADDSRGSTFRPRFSIRCEHLAAKNGGLRGVKVVDKGARFGSPEFHKRGRRAGARALVLPASPLIAAGDTWGTWTVLLGIGAFGIWSEKTSWGSALSGPLVSTLGGLAASNLGLIAASAPAYTTVNAYLLPLAVPLLLYGADLKRVLVDTGRLLVAFLLGSVATTVGTVVALLIVPLRSLGSDGWKIAAALMSRHIGGAVNYVAVSEALGTTPSILAAGLAADNLICALYFTSVFALAANIPPDAINSDGEGNVPKFGGAGLKVEEGAIALALAAAICALGNIMSKSLKLSGGLIPCVTAIVVLLATVSPTWVGSLGPTAEGLAIILMQVFFATIGANASIATVVAKAPSLFAFCLIQVAFHLAMTLGIGKLMGFERKELLLASNANVGGPNTAAGLCAAKGWRTLSVPSILCGIFGIAIATFISIVFGATVLSKM